MTARCLPEDPTFAHESERVVWERLRDVLPGDAMVLANLRIIDERKDHEADVVVLLPDLGVVVLEVKGGSVWYDGEHWRQSGRGERVIHPVRQATDSKYALRGYVESDPRWSRGRIAWTHAVVTPYSSFPAEFAAPDCPRWSVYDKHDLADVAERLEETATRGRQGKASADPR